MPMKNYTCPKCGKRLANRHSLCRHKKICCQSTTTPSIDITASKIDEKKAGYKRPACDDIIHFDSDENDIREQDVPRKRLWDDCAGLNAADKTSKPSKNPKIQSLLGEIINDSAPSHEIPQKKKVNPLVLPKPPPELVPEVLPKPSPEIVAAVFQEKE